MAEGQKKSAENFFRGVKKSLSQNRILLEQAGFPQKVEGRRTGAYLDAILATV